jgi:hypothetical protein
MTHAASRDRRRPVDTEGSAYGLSTDDSGSIHSTAQGASVIQVETLGRYGLLLLFLCAFIAALAAVGFIFTLFELKTVSAQYEVLQYDQQALKAQLVAKGLYTATEH